MAADLMGGAVVTSSEEVDKVQPDSAVLIDGSSPGEVSSGGRLPLAARQYHAVVHLHVIVDIRHQAGLHLSSLKASHNICGIRYNLADGDKILDSSNPHTLR